MYVAGGALVCPPLFPPLYIDDDTQQHLKNITLEGVTLDVLCDVVVNFEHMKELQCMRISDPQEVWLLYTSVCIISVSCALKIPGPPQVWDIASFHFLLMIRSNVIPTVICNRRT